MSAQRNAASTVVPPLRSLYFYITTGCNLACRHCWLSPGYDPGGERFSVLPVHAFDAAIHEALPLGLATVKLTGGEPLMHPDFELLVSRVGDLDLRLIVETNGLECTPAVAGAIAAVPRRFVSVSLDGADAETHDGIRGVAGSFGAACGAIERLVAAGVAPQVIMSLQASNADQTAAMVALATALGAGSVKFNIVQPTGRGEKAALGRDGLTVDRILALGRWVEAELAPGAGLAVYFDHPMVYRTLSRLARGAGGTCGIHRTLGVLATGHYALCGIGVQVPDLVFGAVGAEALVDLWRRHPTLLRLRQAVPSDLGGVCGECLMRHRCQGACVAQTYYRTGRFTSPFWLCEAAAAQGLFPASRRTVDRSTARGAHSAAEAAA